MNDRKTINKLIFPYVFITRLTADNSRAEFAGNFFCLNTKTPKSHHKYGEYNYETNLTAEEIGQLMMGN